ncbi:MAG: hypothetical protein IK085_00110 [Clostridia bacterium]|nr:hypothetical protein [Clostridia bacterium]MBR6004705.1 hypothetical protein [Clostridia bacterium]
MAKKLLALALAFVMLCTVVPFAVFADDGAVDADTRVSAWDADCDLLLVRLLDNEQSAHWKYVAENDEELAKTMLTYTVFSLYDDAWKNGFDKSVSVDNAEAILCSLIEKIDANIGESKIAPIIKVLETATSLNDLLQKVNGFIEISDVLQSKEWSTAFQYIEWAIKVGKLYEEERDRVILAYAQILSVQAANEYYKEMLQYIVDNCSYDVVVTAASNLITDIDESVEKLIKSEVLSAAGFAASKLFTTAAEIAMNTNAYTAVALKVYKTGTSVADTLWNTSDQYALMDELYTTFFAETAVVDWAAESINNAEKYQFAISAVLSLREVGAQALYDLKVAQSGGIIGSIKNQINRNVTSDIIAESTIIEMMREILFNCDLALYSKIESIVIAYTPASMFVGGIPLYSREDAFYADNGYMKVVYNDYSEGYVKVAFVTTDEDVSFLSSSAVTASCIIDKLVYGELVDYSFSDVDIDDGVVVTVPTAFTEAPVYTVTADGETEEFALNDDFVYPEKNEINTAAVIHAVNEVAKKRTNEFLNSILDQFRGIFDSFISKILAFFKIG